MNRYAVLPDERRARGADCVKTGSEQGEQCQATKDEFVERPGGHGGGRRQHSGGKTRANENGRGIRDQEKCDSATRAEVRTESVRPLDRDCRHTADWFGQRLENRLRHPVRLHLELPDRNPRLIFG
jgi:hypothetical protein